MDTEHVLCIASTSSCLLHPGLPVTLAQMHPPGKSGWNHRELAKAAGSRWPIKQQQQQQHYYYARFVYYTSSHIIYYNNIINTLVACSYSSMCIWI